MTEAHAQKKPTVAMLFKKCALIAATRYKGKTYMGLTHPEAYEKIPGFDCNAFDYSKAEDGFVSPDGKFLTRQEASKAVGALKDELFSEDMPLNAALKVKFIQLQPARNSASQDRNSAGGATQSSRRKRKVASRCGGSRQSTPHGQPRRL